MGRRVDSEGFEFAGGREIKNLPDPILHYRVLPTFTNEVQHRYAAELRWESSMDSSILTSG